MLYVEDIERPIAQQIFGSDVDTFVEAAKLIYEKMKPDIIDINLGCPVPKVAVKSQAGSALLKNPEKIKEYNKKYCEKNRDRLAQKAREWREANPERHKENCKKYNKRHREEIIKRATEWNYEHWEKHLEYVRKSKEKKAGGSK